MGRVIEGCDRHQKLLLSDCVDDDVSAENPVPAIDVFFVELDLAALGFEGAAVTGRPGHHPATLLKLIFTASRRSPAKPCGCARRGLVANSWIGCRSGSDWPTFTLC